MQAKNTLIFFKCSRMETQNEKQPKGDPDISLWLMKSVNRRFHLPGVGGGLPNRCEITDIYTHPQKLCIFHLA